ncbi:MAG: flagellar hook-length control protein FliK, partial [Oxalobacteraceae bacterium]
PDPAAALALALLVTTIALEPRLAAVPASAAPSGPADAVATAVGTDAGLSAAPPLVPATLGQSAQEQLVSQLALAASGPDISNISNALTKEQQAAMVPLAGLATTDRQDGDAPALLTNVLTNLVTNTPAETSARLSAQQIALAADGGAAAARGTGEAGKAGETGKIADQALMLDTRLTSQQSKQDETATDSRDRKFSVKPDLRHIEASVAAGIADPATAANTAPADQFSLGTAVPVNPAAMLQQTPAGITQQAAAAPVSLPLAPPVGSNEWGDALGKQVAWMGNANHQVAELQLNPAGLGPLKITLTINNHQAEALFVSAHPEVRAAVEAALPQLRTNLADNGISLGNTSVSADTQQQSAFAQDQASQSSQGKYRPDNASMLNPVAGLSVPAAAPTIAGRRNNVDLFA